MTGVQLLALRRSLGLRQHEFGKLIGVAQGRISQLEKGKRTISEEEEHRIQAMANVLKSKRMPHASSVFQLEIAPDRFHISITAGTIERARSLLQAAISELDQSEEEIDSYDTASDKPTSSEEEPE